MDDRDIGTYLRWFTEFPRERIEGLEAEAADAPEARVGAARDGASTSRPGPTARRRPRGRSPIPRRCSRPEPIVDPAALASLYGSAGGFEFDAGWLAAGAAVLLAEAGVFASRGEARRMIAGGGVTINGSRVADAGNRPSRSPGSGSTSGSASADARSGAAPLGRLDGCAVAARSVSMTSYG